MTAKNKLLWSCIICLFVIPLNGQNLSTQVEITKGEVLGDEEKFSALLFAEPDGKGGLVTLRTYTGGVIISERKAYLLEYYDDDLNLVRSTKIPINNSSLVNLLVSDGRVILTEYRHNKNSDRLEYTAISVDLSDFKMSRRELISVDNPFSGLQMLAGNLFMGDIEMGNVELEMPWMENFQGNNKYIVLYLPVPSFNNSQSRFVVFDLNFNKVFDQTFSNVRQGRTFLVQSMTVSEVDGAVFLLGKTYLSGRGGVFLGKQSEYVYSLFRVDRDGVTSTEFETGDKFISTMAMMLNSHGLFCVGGYSQRRDRNYTGIAFFRLNPENLEIEVKTISSFSKQALVEKYGERKGTRRFERNRGIKEMNYRDFFLDQEGNIFFTAEEYNYRKRFTPFRSKYASPRGLSFSTPVFSPVQREHDYVFRFNDIYAGKINPSGELEWMRTINKKQTTRRSEKPYLSFSTLLNDGKMYLFFNARNKVRAKRDGRTLFRPVRTRGMNVYMVELDADGSVDYRKLIDHKDSRLSYKINQGVVGKNNKLYLEGQRRKDKQILRLELK
jgi:hypothetical protein